ncbi:MAG: tetratricopeptide repeat protein, partial [Bacteroidota bacterium]
GTWPNSRSIHEVTANGVPLVSVEQGGGAVFEGEAFFKEKQWQPAADAFQKETQAYPDNEIAWMKLAMVFFNNLKFPETRQAADELLKIAPENTTAYVYRGLAAMNTNDLASAKTDFQAAVDAEGDNSTALYYLALAQAQSGDKTSALQNLDRVMQLAPNFQQAAELRKQLMQQ